jgi:hypothetical protein
MWSSEKGALLQRRRCDEFPRADVGEEDVRKVRCCRNCLYLGRQIHLLRCASDAAEQSVPKAVSTLPKHKRGSTKLGREYRITGMLIKLQPWELDHRELQ